MMPGGVSHEYVTAAVILVVTAATDHYTSLTVSPDKRVQQVSEACGGSEPSSGLYGRYSAPVGHLRICRASTLTLPGGWLPQGGRPGPSERL
ncbi:hypothetical protein B0T20DRAFT_421783, partial [Sordaria brevicollis]